MFFFNLFLAKKAELFSRATSSKPGVASTDIKTTNQLSTTALTSPVLPTKTAFTHKTAITVRNAHARRSRPALAPLKSQIKKVIPSEKIFLTIHLLGSKQDSKSNGSILIKSLFIIGYV